MSIVALVGLANSAEGTNSITLNCSGKWWVTLHFFSALRRLPMRRFPAPWTVEALDGGFKVIDANKQAIAYVYGHADKRDADTAKSLTLDEARRIASNIAKLPTFLVAET